MATALPTTALCPLPALSVMVVAGPAVTGKAREVAPLRPAALNPRVRMPVRPTRVRSVKPSDPSAPVLSVVVPVSVPPPLAIEAVTATTWATGFPYWSATCTAGCGLSGEPLTAEIVPGSVSTSEL